MSNLFVHQLTCPISQQLFRHPVIASDGHTYEKQSIKQWLQRSSTSPVTNMPLKNTVLITNFMAMSAVDEYLKADPKAADDQYAAYAAYETVVQPVVQQVVRPVEDFLHQRLSSLRTIKDVTVEFGDLCGPYLNDELMIMCINNNIKITSVGRKHMYMLVKFSSIRVIKHAISKGMNLDVVNADYSRPIHAACARGLLDVIKVLVDGGCNLEVENFQGSRPIHIVCAKQSLETIKYIVDRGVNLEARTRKGVKPVHLVMIRSGLERNAILKFLVDKGIDLEAKCSQSDRILHYAIMYSPPDVIMYIIDKGADVETPFTTGLRPIQLICKYSTTAVLKHIALKGVSTRDIIGHCRKSNIMCALWLSITNRRS